MRTFLRNPFSSIQMYPYMYSDSINKNQIFGNRNKKRYARWRNQGVRKVFIAESKVGERTIKRRRERKRKTLSYQSSSNIGTELLNKVQRFARKRKYNNKLPTLEATRLLVRSLADSPANVFTDLPDDILAQPIGESAYSSSSSTFSSLSLSRCLAQRRLLSSRRARSRYNRGVFDSSAQKVFSLYRDRGGSHALPPFALSLSASAQSWISRSCFAPYRADLCIHLALLPFDPPSESSSCRGSLCA